MFKKVLLVMVFAFVAAHVTSPNNLVWAQDSETEEEADFEDAFGSEEGDDFEEFGDDDFEQAETSEEEDSEESLEDEVDLADDDEEGEELQAEEYPNLEEEIEEEDIEEQQAAPVKEDPPVIVEEETVPEVEEIAEESSEPVDAFETRRPDNPNFEYEAKLYEIYLNYNKEPIPQEKWAEIIGNQETNVYKIQKGDSLWGVSQVLFGDGHYWPKIWSKNGNIQNPHLISRGNSIYFLQGNESGGPSFSIGENSSEGSIEGTSAGTGSSENIQITKSGSDSVEEEEEIKLPPPSVVSNPVLHYIPNSLPVLEVSGGSSEYDANGVSSISAIQIQNQGLMTVTSYATEEEPDFENFGTVQEIETGLLSAARYQYVYVSFKKGQARTGEKYLAHINHGPLDNGVKRQKLVSSGDKPYIIEIAGELELIDQVSTKDDDYEEDVFRAMITQNFTLVPKGAFLKKGRVKKIIADGQGTISEVVSQIVGGDGSLRGTRFGTNSLVYLNRGRSDGLRNGQILNIRAVRRLRTKDSIVSNNVEVIGRIKVVNVSQKFSTAVVFQSRGFIQIGDYTGVGRLLPQTSPSENEEGKTLAENLIDDVQEEPEEDDIQDNAEIENNDEDDELIDDFDESELEEEDSESL